MSGREPGRQPAAIGSFIRTVKMVAWSLLGIRKNSEREKDAAQVNPFHIIVVGLVTVLILVIGLIVVVNLVVAK